MYFEKAKAIRPDQVGGLPRIFVIDYGGGNYNYISFLYMTERELESFWKMPLQEQVCFLKENCNHHHREPRVRGGHSSKENLMVVTTMSHDMYNRLVRIAAGLAGISVKQKKWEKNVTSRHIAWALSEVFNIAKVLLCDPDTKKLKNPENVEEDFRGCWTPNSANIKMRIRNGLVYFLAKED